jgi:hypothetical protein
MMMTAPTKFVWTDPTTNVDGSPIAAGEVTAYEIGVRDTTATGSAAGTYPFGIKAPPSATFEPFSALQPALPIGVLLAAAVRTDTGAVDGNNNPINSAWTAEVTFTLPVPPPIPNPPTGFTVA